MLKKLSWSLISDLNSCAKKVYHLRVARDVHKGPPHPSAVAGIAAHEKMQGELQAGQLPDDPLIVSLLQQVRGELTIERGLAVDENFDPTTVGDPNAVLTGFIDLMYDDGDTLFMIDIKTGKRRTDTRQLQLYAALGFLSWPEVQRVNTAYAWVKSQELDLESYHRKDLPVLMEPFIDAQRKIRQYTANNFWPAKPSGLCKFCPVGADKCQYKR